MFFLLLDRFRPVIKRGDLTHLYLRFNTHLLSESFIGGLVLLNSCNRGYGVLDYEVVSSTLNIEMSN